MTDEERLSKLESTIRNFRLVTNGTDQIQGGFAKLPDKSSDIFQRLSNVEKSFKDFKISGGNGVNVEGSIHKGFCVTIDKQTICGESTLVPITGACCIGESCVITTEEDCTNAGGTYQGDNVSCDPDPCAAGTCNISVTASGTMTIDGTCDSGISFTTDTPASLTGSPFLIQSQGLCGGEWCATLVGFNFSGGSLTEACGATTQELSIGADCSLGLVQDPGVTCDMTFYPTGTWLLSTPGYSFSGAGLGSCVPCSDTDVSAALHVVTPGSNMISTSQGGITVVFTFTFSV